MDSRVPPPPGESTEGLGRRLEEVDQEFVALWRNMSSLWGISPTMAHDPRRAVHQRRGPVDGRPHGASGNLAQNVSMNLPMLIEWGLVRRVHRKGDRREYYEALTDVWEMFTLVATQCKRREIDPMLNTLRQCSPAQSRSARRNNLLGNRRWPAASCRRSSRLSRPGRCPGSRFLRATRVPAHRHGVADAKEQ